MFFKKSNEPDRLDVVIDKTVEELMGTEATSREFTRVLAALDKLTDLQKTRFSSRRVSPDTIALIAANLVGILLILNHEHAGVVTSKALGFVQRLGR